MANHLTGAERHNRRMDKIFKEYLENEREVVLHMKGVDYRTILDLLVKAHKDSHESCYANLIDKLSNQQ